MRKIGCFYKWQWKSGHFGNRQWLQDFIWFSLLLFFLFSFVLFLSLFFLFPFYSYFLHCFLFNLFQTAFHSSPLFSFFLLFLFSFVLFLSLFIPLSFLFLFSAPVHNSILVIDYLTKMGIKTVAHPPYSRDLAQRLSLWDNWGDERSCDEGHWHAPHTRGLLWGFPEVVGTVQQMHCSRRRLLRRGLVFHEYTINESVNTKKSGNLFNDTRIWSYKRIIIRYLELYNYMQTNSFYWKEIDTLNQIVYKLL